MYEYIDQIRIVLLSMLPFLITLSYLGKDNPLVKMKSLPTPVTNDSLAAEIKRTKGRALKVYSAASLLSGILLYYLLKQDYWFISLLFLSMHIAFVSNYVCVRLNLKDIVVFITYMLTTLMVVLLSPEVWYAQLGLLILTSMVVSAITTFMTGLTSSMLRLFLGNSPHYLKVSNEILRWKMKKTNIGE